jgi:D-alanyl-D-alanine carboxypeptidase
MFRYYSSLAVLILMCSVGFVAVAGRQQPVTKQSTVVIPANGSSAKANEVARIDHDAALWERSIAENTRLQNEMDWIFGGKHQTGWSLYSLLIAQNIGAGDAKPQTPEFAAAVAQWQRQHQVSGNSGVIDVSTWGELMQEFQSRRIKDRQPSEHLVTIPIEDCYDETRELELRKVDLATYEAYKRMVAAAIVDLSKDPRTAEGLTSSNKFLKIISAYRSPEYQAELRRRSPNATSAALAVSSPHSTGKALDIYVGGVPTSTENGNRAIQVATPVYQWLVKNAIRFGFRPYFYEPWHWEYNPSAESPEKTASAKTEVR